MNEQKAREILGHLVEGDNSLYSDVPWLFWEGGSQVEIDGELNANKLLAIAWWVENMAIENKGKE